MELDNRDKLEELIQAACIVSAVLKSFCVKKRNYKTFHPASAIDANKVSR